MEEAKHELNKAVDESYNYFSKQNFPPEKYKALINTDTADGVRYHLVIYNKDYLSISEYHLIQTLFREKMFNHTIDKVDKCGRKLSTHKSIVAKKQQKVDTLGIAIEKINNDSIDDIDLELLITAKVEIQKEEEMLRSLIKKYQRNFVVRSYWRPIEQKIEILLGIANKAKQLMSLTEEAQKLFSKNP